MTTLKRSAKDLANFSKTQFEIWFEKIKKEYGKEGMKFILADVDSQRKIKGIEPKYKTFAQKFYDFMIAKENGYKCTTAITYLNRKDVVYLVNSVALYLQAKFNRNFVPFPLK